MVGRKITQVNAAKAAFLTQAQVAPAKILFGIADEDKPVDLEDRPDNDDEPGGNRVPRRLHSHFDVIHALVDALRFIFFQCRACRCGVLQVAFPFRRD